MGGIVPSHVHLVVEASSFFSLRTSNAYSQSSVDHDLDHIEQADFKSCEDVSHGVPIRISCSELRAFARGTVLKRGICASNRSAIECLYKQLTTAPRLIATKPDDAKGELPGFSELSTLHLYISWTLWMSHTLNMYYHKY